MSRDSYGELTSMSDATLAEDNIFSSQGGDDEITDAGNALWSYQHENRINGVPVAEEDRGLLIGSDDMLNVAFVLERHPRSMLLKLSLSCEDHHDKEKYDALLENVYNGSAIIVDEDRQFDAAKGCFIVWVRYDELQYVLHDRFKYLREELNNA